MNEEQAKAQGYKVDRTCYPWAAYKGPRLAPIEIVEIISEREEEAFEAGYRQCQMDFQQAVMDVNHKACMKGMEKRLERLRKSERKENKEITP